MADESPQATEVNIDKQRLGVVYAHALIGAAEKQQASADELVDELESLVNDVLSRFPDLEATLASPRIAPAEKEQLLDRVFGGRASEGLLTFLKVVGRHGRLDCLRQIRTAAREELNRLRGRISVIVTTASAVDEGLKSQIASKLEASTGLPVNLECRVDSSIIGGLIIRVGDTVYDSSVRNQLAQLKRDTLNKTYEQLRDSTDRFAVSG